MVVDELGFHQATSTAELLADRGCDVEIVTNGMVVGQDLGITLDLETWNVKAHNLGIIQSVDLVPMGVSRTRCRRGRRRRPGPPAPPDRDGPGPPLRLGGLLGPPAAGGRPVAGTRRRAVRGPPDRRLPGPPTGPRRGHRGRPGGGGPVTVPWTVDGGCRRDGPWPGVARDGACRRVRRWPRPAVGWWWSATGPRRPSGAGRRDPRPVGRHRARLPPGRPGRRPWPRWWPSDTLVVLPASPDGRDLAPRLAAALDRPLVARAIGATVTDAADGPVRRPGRGVPGWTTWC